MSAVSALLARRQHAAARVPHAPAQARSAPEGAQPPSENGRHAVAPPRDLLALRLADAVRRRPAEAVLARRAQAAGNEARTPGRPLQPALREQMEHGFSESFGGVRLHLGSQLPADYRAAAVTIGEHVHIAPAQPPPESAPGGFLLAHELAHVVQQRHGSAGCDPGGHARLLADTSLEAEAWAAAEAVGGGQRARIARRGGRSSGLERPAQPAIGFEFAIGWEVAQRNWGRGTHQLPKYAKLHYGQGWRMEADGKDIEFVVDPVEEGAANVQELTDVMDDMEDYIQNQMLPHRAQRLIRDAPFVTEWWWGVEVQTNNSDIDGNPQATAGVRQDRLIALYRSLQRTPQGALPQAVHALGGQAADFYARKAARAAGAANARDPNRPGHVPSPALKGLLALISQYLELGRGVAPLQAVKYMAWIMSRTHFGHLFSRVPEAAYYRAHRADWVAFVCNQVMTATGVAAVAPLGAVIERPITDGGTLVGPARGQIPVTRRDWLLGMLDGQDLLTAAANPVGFFSGSAHRNTYLDSRRNLGHRLRGLGALGTKMDDTVAGAGTGVILEFRAAQTHLHHGLWRDWAMRTHRFITAINASPSANTIVQMGMPPPVHVPVPVHVPLHGAPLLAGGAVG